MVLLRCWVPLLLQLVLLQLKLHKLLRQHVVLGHWHCGAQVVMPHCVRLLFMLRQEMTEGAHSRGRERTKANGGVEKVGGTTLRSNMGTLRFPSWHQALHVAKTVIAHVMALLVLVRLVRLVLLVLMIQGS